MTLRSKLLSRFADWALSKNPVGGYAGENDERWAYTIVGDDGSPYLTRILLTRTRALKWLKDLTGLGVYLHHFHRPDGDQDMHDHPWNVGASLVLNGAYVEERVDQIVEQRVPSKCGDNWCRVDDCRAYTERTVLTDTQLVRFFNYLTGEDFHAVRSLQGDVWTLFFTRGRFQDWGFLVDGAKVPWREYLSGLNEAGGEALEAIGKNWHVWRRPAAGFFNGPPWENDVYYRERIRAAMRARAREELK